MSVRVSRSKSQSVCVTNPPTQPAIHPAPEQHHHKQQKGSWPDSVLFPQPFSQDCPLWFVCPPVSPAWSWCMVAELMQGGARLFLFPAIAERLENCEGGEDQTTAQQQLLLYGERAVVTFAVFLSLIAVVKCLRPIVSWLVPRSERMAQWLHDKSSISAGNLICYYALAQLR